MSVFKRLPGSHIHVRAPVMIGVILLLVVVLSGFCYYRVSAELGPFPGRLAAPSLAGGSC